MAVKPAAADKAKRLLRYDMAVLAGTVRQAIRNWRDGVFLAIFLALVLLSVRIGFEAIPEGYRLLALGAAMVPSGFLADLAMRRRLGFHSSETPLAAEALDPLTGRIYAVFGHACCLAVAGPAAAALAPLAVAGVTGGWLAGAALSRLSARLLFRDTGGARRWLAGRRGRISRIWFSRRRYGPLLFPLVVFVASLAHLMAVEQAAGIAAVTAVIFVALLSPLDHATINFERLSGYGVVQSLRRNLKPALIVSLALAAAAALSLAPLYVASVALPCMLVLTYRALQLMLFRIFSPRVAELTLICILWATALIGLMVPFALPVAVVILLVLIARRASRLTWCMP